MLVVGTSPVELRAEGVRRHQQEDAYCTALPHPVNLSFLEGTKAGRKPQEEHLDSFAGTETERARSRPESPGEARIGDASR
jgi:hypothetical protein